MAARLLLYAVAFVAALPLVSRGDDECVRSYLDLRRLIGKEDYERAFGHCVELLERFPDFPPLYEAIAELGLYTRRWDRSEEFFAERIRKGIEVPLSLYGYASSLASRDDHANAIQFCMEAIERGLTYSGVYKELAYAYEKAYGDNEALSMLGRLSRRFPRSAGYHYAVAVELWSLGDFRPVVVRLKEAVALDPAQPRYGDALAVADLHLAYSRRKAERVEARRALATARGDIAGSQFLISSLLSDQIYAGDHRRRDTVLQQSTAEASEFGFLRWLGWNLQRRADIEGLSSRLAQARQHSIVARVLALRSNDPRLAMVALQRISNAFLDAGILDSALCFARLRWSLSSRTTSPSDYVSGLGKIALILVHMGELKLANEYCIEALAEADSKGVDAITLAEVETAFGMVQERFGNLQMAYRHHMLARKVLGTGIELPYFSAVNSGNLGRISLLLGHLEDASRFLNQQIRFAEKVGYLSEQANALINLGDLVFARRQYMRSSTYYSEALNLATTIGSLHLKYESLSRLARLARYLGDVEPSLHFYNDLEGVGLLCILNGQTIFPDLCHALKEKAHLEFTTKRWQSGLTTLATAKLVELYSHIDASYINYSGSEGPSLDSLHTAKERLASALAALGKAIGNKTPSLSSRSAELLAMTDVVDARLAISQLTRSVLSKCTKNWQTSLGGWILPELQYYLHAESSCVIQYLVRDEAVTALYIDGDKIEYHRLGIAKENLEKLVRMLSPVLKEGGIAVPLLHPSMAVFDLRVSNDLYRVLVEPLWGHIQRAKRLILLQDGLLQNLPFEALVTQLGVGDAASRFLIQQTEVSYCQFLRQLRPKETSENISSSILVVADPRLMEDRELGHASDRIMGSGALSGFPASGLSGARTEADAIRKIFGPQSRLMVGMNATKERLVLALPVSRLIHLGTHSVFTNSDADFIGLALSRSTSAGNDGVLRLYELQTVSLNTELVVLNGCKTARGLEEDMSWSPAFAFAVAGARAVIGTLWDVDDETSKDLICEFYAGIGSGLDVSAALRQAKLAEIAKGNGNPLRWASHVIIGDPKAFKGFARTAAFSGLLPSWLLRILLCSGISSISCLVALVLFASTTVGTNRDKRFVRSR